MKFADLEREVSFKAVRSSGPGGQNVNKVSSRAQLYWDFKLSNLLTNEQKALVELKLQNLINREGLIFLSSDEFRDLERNKHRCLEKLLQFLTSAFHTPKLRKKTKPSISSRIKKLEKKKKHGIQKSLRRKVDW